MRKVRAVLVVTALAALASAVDARIPSPPANRVKLCGSPSGCDSCHNAPGAPSIPGANSFFGINGPVPQPLPATYTPDQNYQLLMRFVEGNPTRCNDASAGPCSLQPVNCGFGFEIAAIFTDASNQCAPLTAEQAGCFAAGTDQTILCGAGGGTGCGACSGATPVQYLAHNCGIEPDTGTTDTKTWLIDWTAPPARTPPGRVCFFVAVNSVNGNDDPSGDKPWFWSDLAGVGVSLCWDEATAPTGCDLLTASVATIGPPTDKAALFSDAASCAPDRVPASVAVAGFTGLAPAEQDVDPVEGGDPLIVYQVDCGASCGGTLFAVKRGTSPGQQVHVSFVP